MEKSKLKILVVKRDKIGDMLLTTAVLGWLRQELPDAEIHVLANDYNSWVLAGNADVDRVWSVPRVRSRGGFAPGDLWRTLWMLWRLRWMHFDWVLVGNGEESPRAIKRGLSVHGKHTVAYCTVPERWPDLAHALPIPDDLHETQRLAHLAISIGLQPPSQLPAPRYVLPAAGQAFAASWLANHGLAPFGYIVLGLGARRAKKQPSTRQVLDWSAHVAQRWGLKTVFIWTPGKSDDTSYPGDDDVDEPVLAAASPHIIPFRGPLHEAIALIWQARSSLFPDSGLMHFAAASPGGVLGFFAERDASPSPIQWAPVGPRSHWVEAKHQVAELGDDQVLAPLDGLIASFHEPASGAV
jgi:ADP-heptose:LPS heptosyltransferase